MKRDLWTIDRTLLAALWTLALVNLITVRIPDRSRQGGNDFLSFYAGGTLALAPGGLLYDHSGIRRVQQERAGWDSSELAFVRLPFYATMLAPLSSLTYPAAYRIWLGIQAAALMACIAVLHPWIPWWWTLGALLASVPLYAALVNGQDVPLLLLIVATFLRLYRAGNDHVRSGLVLSLTAIKFHLFFLSLPLLLIRRRQWRVCLGLGLGLAFLTAVSFWGQGADWPSRFARQVLSPAIGPNPASMPNWHGLTNGSIVLELAASFLTLLTLSVVVSSSVIADSSTAFAVALLAGVLVSHHAYVQDAAILIPAALWILVSPTHHWSLKVCGLLVLSPFPWLYFLSRSVVRP
jgi:hypothetical protein